MQFITAESFEALEMFRFYRDGFLPEAGGFADQPARVVDQLKVISAIVDEAERERRERLCSR